MEQMPKPDPVFLPPTEKEQKPDPAPVQKEVAAEQQEAAMEPNPPEERGGGQPRQEEVLSPLEEMKRLELARQNEQLKREAALERQPTSSGIAALMEYVQQHAKEDPLLKEGRDAGARSGDPFAPNKKCDLT